MESVKIPELLNGWPWVPLSKRNGITGEDSTLIAFYWEARGKTNLHPSFQSFIAPFSKNFRLYSTFCLLTWFRWSEESRFSSSYCTSVVKHINSWHCNDIVNLFFSTGTLDHLQNGQFGSCWQCGGWWWEETVYVNARPGIPNISFKSLADDPKL